MSKKELPVAKEIADEVERQNSGGEPVKKEEGEKKGVCKNCQRPTGTENDQNFCMSCRFETL